LRQYSFAKKLQSQAVITEKLSKTLSSEKPAREMLVKWTTSYLANKSSSGATALKR